MLTLSVFFLLQALNVVLTHTTADFDTLAAAVGLAKLWQDERPDDGENNEIDHLRSIYTFTGGRPEQN